MSEKKTGNNKTLMIVAIVVLAAAIGGYMLFNAGLLGGNSCAALLRRYNGAKGTEDYTIMNEVFPLMMEKGCAFD